MTQEHINPKPQHQPIQYQSIQPQHQHNQPQPQRQPQPQHAYFVQLKDNNPENTVVIQQHEPTAQEYLKEQQSRQKLRAYVSISVNKYLIQQYIKRHKLLPSNQSDKFLRKKFANAYKENRKSIQQLLYKYAPFTPDQFKNQYYRSRNQQKSFYRFVECACICFIAYYVYGRSYKWFMRQQHIAFRYISLTGLFLFTSTFYTNITNYNKYLVLSNARLLQSIVTTHQNICILQHNKQKLRQFCKDSQQLFNKLQKKGLV